MYRIGETLPVLYDPDEVMPPAIDSWSSLWGVHLMCLVTGLLFWGGGASVYLTAGRRLFGGE